jgi:hypothetical protein
MGQSLSDQVSAHVLCKAISDAKFACASSNVLCGSIWKDDGAFNATPSFRYALLQKGGFVFLGCGVEL